jgi:hypothetical protein
MGNHEYRKIARFVRVKKKIKLGQGLRDCVKDEIKKF